MAVVSALAWVCACSGGEDDPGEDPCNPDVHCVRESDGSTRCENGYTWAFPDDKDDYRCVSDLSGDGDGDEIDPDQSCAGRCGEFSLQTCSCDSECGEVGDCCADYVARCVEGGDGDGDVIGDGDGDIVGDGDGDVIGDGDGDVDVGPGNLVHSGSLTINSAAELDEFIHSGIGEVTGDLEFEGIFGVSTIVIPNLHTVGNRLKLENAGAPTMRFPNLTSVAELHIRSDGSLVEADLPALLTAEIVRVEYASALQRLKLPAFNPSFDGYDPSINIDQAGALQSVDLSSWQTGHLSIKSTSLTSLSAPALQTAASLTMQVNSSLQTISFPALTAVFDGSLRLYNNAAVTSVSLPALATVSNTLEISGHSQLTSINLNGLQQTQDLWITDNTSYPGCSALAIYESLIDLGNFPSWIDLSGNGPGCESQMASCQYRCAGQAPSDTCQCSYAGSTACSDYSTYCN